MQEGTARVGAIHIKQRSRKYQQSHPHMHPVYNTNMWRKFTFAFWPGYRLHVKMIMRPQLKLGWPPFFLNATGSNNNNNNNNDNDNDNNNNNNNHAKKHQCSISHWAPILEGSGGEG